MEIKELREKNKQELEKLFRESRHRLRELRFVLASGKAKNHREIREHRKTIARIFTLFSEKERQSGGEIK